MLFCKGLYFDQFNLRNLTKLLLLFTILTLELTIRGIFYQKKLDRRQYKPEILSKRHIKLHLKIWLQFSLSIPETKISHLSVSAFFHGENIY